MVKGAEHVSYVPALPPAQFYLYCYTAKPCWAGWAHTPCSLLGYSPAGWLPTGSRACCSWKQGACGWEWQAEWGSVVLHGLLQPPGVGAEHCLSCSAWSACNLLMDQGQNSSDSKRRATSSEYLRCPFSPSSNKGQRENQRQERIADIQPQIYYLSACHMFKLWAENTLRSCSRAHKYGRQKPKAQNLSAGCSLGNGQGMRSEPRGVKAFLKLLLNCTVNTVGLLVID